jgi:hypothetical protein
MTLKIVEDRPTPKEVYSASHLLQFVAWHILTVQVDWRPYALALIAAWGGVLFGYAQWSLSLGQHTEHFVFIDMTLLSSEVL